MMGTKSSIQRASQRLASGAVVALMLCFNVSATAQSTETEHYKGIQPAGAAVTGGYLHEAKALMPAVEATAPVSTGGLHDGIKVHGNWHIVVKNPDGTVSTDRKFENSYQAGPMLIGLLTGNFSMGQWMVALDPATSYGGPCSGTYTICAMAQSLSAIPATSYCGNYQCVGGLTVTGNYGTNEVGPYSVVLAGSITAVTAGTIGSVQTIYGACGNSTQPADPTGTTTTSTAACETTTNAATTLIGPFTTADLAPTISVVSGQIIQVTVTFSFS